MGRRPRAAIAIALLLASACGAERAALVELVPESRGDGMCVWAFGDGEQVFAERYPTERGAMAPPEGSLTFVAGPRVSREVVVGARVLRGGAVVGEARARIPFTDGVTERTLRVARCAPFDPGPALPLEAVGALGAGDVTAMIAGDVDGDGRDELIGVAADGALHVLHLDAPGAVSEAAFAAPAGARLGALADLDGDCALDGVLVGDETRLIDAIGVAPSSSGALPSARDAAVGAPTGLPALVRVDAEALTVAPTGAGAPRSVAGAFDHVAVDDLDGDGRDDVVASGAAGTRLFLGGDGALTEREDALPAIVRGATGPLALVDADGDGDVDLVTSLGLEARLAVNRGDGLLELRGGPIALDADVTRAAAGDVDGDCADELVLVGADGSVVVASFRDGALTARAETWPTTLDAAIGDLDGDGLRELALLTPEGDVWWWRP